MTPEEIRKLLGGYATGTLTAGEQQALFEAALQDQELFDELAREQSLRDLLRDPSARAHLLASIEEKPRPWWRRIHRGALIGAVAVAACVELAVIAHFGRPKPAATPPLVAEVKPAPAANLALNWPNAPPPAVAVKAEPAGNPALNRPTGSPAEAVKKEPPAPVKAEPVVTAGLKRPTAPASKKELTAAEEPAPAARRAAAAPRVMAELAEKDANLAQPVPAPAAAPPPGSPAQATAAPVAAPSPIQMQAQTGALGGLGGAPPAAAQDARSLFYAQPILDRTQFLPSQNGLLAGQQVRQMAIRAAPALMAPNPGVKWTALRKQEDGLFSQVDPEQIKAGDTIKLRLVPNDNGYLSVMDGGKPLVPERRVVRLEPFETPEITSAAGQKELIVVLSRRAPPGTRDGEPQPAQPQPPQATAAGMLRPVAAEQVSQADRNEHAVYEVKKASNPLAPVLVRITLNFQ